MRKILFLALTVFLALAAAGPVKAETLRIGILPVLDSLPLQVAKKEGIFAKHGLDVDLALFTSALERDTAMKSGQLDGYFGDMIATLVLMDSGTSMRIVTVTFISTPGRPMFGVVTKPGFEKPEQGKPLTIAISKTTIIEYLLDRIIQAGLLPNLTFERIEIKNIPIRMQMLAAGEIDTALLPEPMASLAASKGGKILATDESLNIPLTVLSISEKMLAKPGLHKALVAAYGEAVTRIREHPEAYRELMGEACWIPDPMLPSFPIYDYPMPALPSEQDVADVESWMTAHGLIKTAPAYAGIVEPLR